MPDQPIDPVPAVEPPGSGAPGTPAASEVGGRERLLAALRRPSRRQLVVALLLGLVGYAGVVQVRAAEVDDSYSTLRQQDLIDVLNGLAGARQRAESQLADLQRTRAQLQSDTSRRRAALEQAQQQADTLSVLAGLVPVTGPGVRITITETTGSVEIDSLIDTLQELRTVGAEAIAFNGQVRVVAQSAFEDGVGGILVDGTLLQPPYVIDVIGDPAVLAGAINFADGPRLKLEEDGARVEVDRLPSLDITVVRKPVQPQFAAPQSGGP